MLIPLTLIAVLMIIKKRSIASAMLHFDESAFVVTLYKPGSDGIESETHFLWSDIAAYKPYFDTKNNTCLTLYLKDKKKRSFIFRDNKTYEEALAQESVFSNFYFFVVEYNKRHEQQKILPRPGFLATNIGKYVILAETGILILAVALHFIKSDFSHVYYLLLGIALLVPQILNRAQNMSMYNKINRL
jgi:hypothetical protein